MSRDPEVEILPPDPRWQPSVDSEVEYEARPAAPGVVSDVYEAVAEERPDPSPFAATASTTPGDPRVIARLLGISWRLAGAVALVAFLVWALDLLGPGSVQRAVDWLRGEPYWGRALVIVAIGAGVPFFVPVGPLALIPAYCWGTAEGIALGIAGALLGGTVNYWISRKFIGPHVLAWLQGNELLRSLYLTIDRRGARVLLGLRLSPLMPFGLLSYLGGLTSIRWPLFALLMALGGLPWTSVYAVAGGLLRDSQQAVDLSAVGDGPMTSLMRWGGLGLTVALAVWIGRVARRDLLQMRAERRL